MHLRNFSMVRWLKFSNQQSDRDEEKSHRYCSTRLDFFAPQGCSRAQPTSRFPSALAAWSEMEFPFKSKALADDRKTYPLSWLIRFDSTIRVTDDFVDEFGQTCYLFAPAMEEFRQDPRKRRKIVHAKTKSSPRPTSFVPLMRGAESEDAALHRLAIFSNLWQRQEDPLNVRD